MELSELISEYKRLLREAENSPGLDEEKILEQLAQIRKDYERITGKDITKEIL
jgi:hypothetical protein